MKMSWICREECYLVFSQGVLWISSDRDDRMGAKFKTPKNPYSLTQYPKKSHAEYLSCKNFQRNYANYAGYTGTIMNLHIVLNTLKNPFLNQATQKNSCQNFLPEKIPKLKISNPPKSFNHPCHLKSRVAPWECLDQVQSTWFVGCLKQALKILQLCLVYCSSRMLNGSSRLIFTTLKTL